MFDVAADGEAVRVQALVNATGVNSLRPVFGPAKVGGARWAAA